VVVSELNHVRAEVDAEQGVPLEDITNTQVELCVSSLGSGLKECREEMEELKDALSRIINAQAHE